MKKIATVILILTILASSAWAVEGSNADKTLSPYFFIQNEDENLDHFPLKKTDVEVVVSGVIADVTVRQHYSNNGNRPLNGRYIFPGSTRAAVHGMKMIIGERVITAKIKEKKEAKKIFTQAKKAGKSASLLTQQRPNVFSMDVANILPGDDIKIELNYTELLVPTDGTYEFVYPTVVGPRYSGMLEADAPESEKWVKNPYLKKGSDPRTDFDISVHLSTGLPLQEAVCKTHDTNIIYENNSVAKIRLVQAEDFSGDRDFILQYRLAGKEIASGLMLYEGEDENFFLMMVQPPERIHPNQIPGREYVFVVDVSGSMNGFPLNMAKTLLRNLIGDLKPTDTFNLMLFAGASKVMAPQSVPAIPQNINNAIAILNRQQGGGSTQLLSAMKKAMALPTKEGVSRTLVVITDGYIHAEKDVFEAIGANLNQTNVFTFGIGSSVNRYLIEGMAKAGMGEPFVVTKPEDAPCTAIKFRKYVSAPVLTNIKINYNGFDAYDIEPPSIPDVFAKRPVIIFGKWQGKRQGIIELTGISGEGTFRKSVDVSNTEPHDNSSALQHLWARARISRLSDFNLKKGDPENQQEILSLGLTYNLLTAYTSFVAVDEVIRNSEGKADDVKQPLPLPKDVSNPAVGVSVSNVPEPDMLLMLSILLFIGGIFLLRRSGFIKSISRNWSRGDAR